MAVACTSTAGFGGPHLGVSGTVNNTVNLRSGTYTIACRVRWDTSNTSQDHIAIGIAVSAADGSGLYIQRVGGETATQISAYRTNTSGITLQEAIIASAYGSTTAWHHVCATYDGTTLRTYLDGVASGTIASGTTTCTNANAGYLVVAGPATNTTADSVFFKRALTAQEVFQLARERLPLNRRSDCIGWYPMLAGGSNTITDLGRDYSGNQNDASIQASGTGNPAVSNASVPFPWGGRSGRIIYSPPSVFDLGSVAGATTTTGSVALTALAALAPSGSTQTTGAVTLGASKAIASAGATNVTGAVALAALKALTAAGSTNVTGAVALGASEAISPAGSTTTTGAVTLGATEALAPSGTTNVTGAVALGLSAPLAPAGATQTTGAVTLGASEAITPSGTTNTTGAVVFGELAALAPAGLTATTGSVTLGSSAGLALTPAGTTNTTGAVTLTELAALAPAGTTQTTGAVTLAVLEALTPAGTTNVTGAVGLGLTAPLPAAGSTQTTGAVQLGIGLQLVAAGSTNTTGAVALTELAAVVPAGVTNVTGAVAMGKLIAFPSAGTTQCFGFVTLGGGTGPTATGGPFKGNVARRTMYAGRRRMRVV